VLPVALMDASFCVMFSQQKYMVACLCHVNILLYLKTQLEKLFTKNFVKKMIVFRKMFQ